MQILKQLFARYLVVTYSDGVAKEHYAKDWDEALDVMASYPANASCGAYERFLGFTALAPMASRFA